MTVVCPKCSSKAFKRNGYTRHGKQNHRCLDCGRQFSMEPEVNFVFEVASQDKSASPEAENSTQASAIPTGV